MDRSFSNRRDESKLEALENRSHHREALKLDNDYTESSLDLIQQDGIPSLQSSSRPSSTHSSSSDDQDSSSSDTKIKLVRKSTDVDIYELKTKITVDKKRFSSEGLPKSRLNDVKFTNVQSILDSSGSWSNEFAGFYVLFWFAVAVIVVNSVVTYTLTNGWESQIINILTTDLIPIALTDLWMYLSLYGVYLLHYLIKLGYLDWGHSGWILSSIYEFVFIFHFTSFAERRHFPWIGKIFLYLHSLVMLMKMHSYSFYNGYLWKLKKELDFSKGFLKKYDLSNDKQTHDLITDSISFCQFELDSQSISLKFPENINSKNFFWYTMFPTLVYQINYPRTSKIRWSYVGEKLTAIFGVIVLMIIIAQNTMYPLALKAIELHDLPIIERIKLYPLLLLNITPSFLLIYILVWYLIWDAILNCIAELTTFGDRDFYGPWWNCVSWDQFARLWNVPVHKFLLRHVYHSSISALHLSKTGATVFTFLLSSIVHEGAMFVIFHRLRGYLLILQMFQLPLVAISKTKYLRDKRTLGNIVFWFGIATGPSLMCTLYLTF